MLELQMGSTAQRLEGGLEASTDANAPQRPVLTARLKSGPPGSIATVMDAISPSYPTSVAADMRYVRAYLGGVEDSPALLLYEVDPRGHVHRHVEVTLDGARFAPEDLLLLGPLDADALVVHRGAEEIDAQAFNALWNEVETSRRFRSELPDPTTSQTGRIVHGDQMLCICWNPDGRPPQAGMSSVPGIAQLFVMGGGEQVRAVQTALFLGIPCEWDLPQTPRAVTGHGSSPSQS